MKKYTILFGALLLAFLLSACGGKVLDDLKSEDAVQAGLEQDDLKSEDAIQADLERDDLKSEDAIQADLEQSEHFWYLLAPRATNEYSITDFAINGRITKSEESDTIAVTVTAESEYAVYTGTFNVKYVYHEETGYVYDSVYQGTPGTYSEVKLPSDDFAKTYFELEMASINGTLQTAEIERIPSDDRICKMNAVYESRDDAAHCTSTISAYAISCFDGGTWQKEGANMSIKVTDETYSYDMVNEVYWLADPVFGGVELINAYVVDGHQYYDNFVYYSYADINYEDVIKYGFIGEQMRILEESCYIGCDGYGLLGEATGPIDDQMAISYLEQIKRENSDILIILNPELYLSEILMIPDSVIVAKQYVDENGLQVAEVAHKGTYAYEEALKQ